MPGDVLNPSINGNTAVFSGTLNPKDIAKIIKVLNNHKIEKINFDRVKFPKTTRENQAALLNALKANESLKEVHFNYCDLNNNYPIVRDFGDWYVGQFRKNTDSKPKSNKALTFAVNGEHIDGLTKNNEVSFRNIYLANKGYTINAQDNPNGEGKLLSVVKAPQKSANNSVQAKKIKQQGEPTQQQLINDSDNLVIEPLFAGITDTPAKSVSAEIRTAESVAEPVEAAQLQQAKIEAALEVQQTPAAQSVKIVTPASATLNVVPEPQTAIINEAPVVERKEATLHTAKEAKLVSATFATVDQPKAQQPKVDNIVRVEPKLEKAIINKKTDDFGADISTLYADKEVNYQGIQQLFAEPKEVAQEKAEAHKNAGNVFSDNSDNIKAIFTEAPKSVVLPKLNNQPATVSKVPASVASDELASVFTPKSRVTHVIQNVTVETYVATSNWLFQLVESAAKIMANAIAVAAINLVSNALQVMAPKSQHIATLNHAADVVAGHAQQAAREDFSQAIAGIRNHGFFAQTGPWILYMLLVKKIKFARIIYKKQPPVVRKSTTIKVHTEVFNSTRFTLIKVNN
ncbi:MAG: hypothetical protein Tsb005_07410 [Gammaproteobacteria bacterium]